VSDSPVRPTAGEEPDEGARGGGAPAPAGSERARRALAWAEEQPLAGAAPAPADAAVLAGLRRNAQALQAARRWLSADSEEELADSYATEWFLDNHYLIRDAARQALQDLPLAFYRRLPRLAAGAAFEGLPRVYALAHRLVEESEARLDLRAVEEQLEAYQERAPLTMGELWALPALLRVVLLERLTESVERLTAARFGPEADLRAVQASPPAAGQAAPAPPSPAPPPGWVAGPVAVNDDEQVANCVVSLRALKVHDWERFFERLSLVERVLRGDSTGDYARMTFATRDRYRKVVERLAAGTGVAETRVAEEAVALAAAADAAWVGPDDDNSARRRAHVGYYLLDAGLPLLRRRLGYRPTAAEQAREWVFAHPARVYLGAIGLVTFTLLALALRHAAWGGASVPGQLLVLLVVLVPALGIGVGLVNLLLGYALRPRQLPKLDLSQGVPERYRTAVVVPALLDSPAGVDELLEQLERHYLGDPDPELLFALLTDFPDAATAEVAGDEELLRRAIDGVGRLNQRYGGGRRPFYLLHRQRLWNESEGAWMGWERKRGKLVELNRLLRGARDTSYTVQVGDLTRLPGVRYVLTLDADTRLPPGAAARLIGTLAHPLNRAEFDADGRVVAGYSLLQPRTDILPESANATPFSRLFVGENGLDLYTLAVSDVYMDLFGEGIYVGKGLYAVDDFERALAGKVPENSVLSHDLLEGVYGRVALVTDVVLFEEYPPNYLAQVLRTQRWVRGDWQLLPWLRDALTGGGERDATGLGVMGAWKLFDNLRRSLLAPAVVLMLGCGWLLFPGLPLVWTLMALGALLVPLLGSAVSTLVRALAPRRGGPDEAPRRTTVAWRPLVDGLRRFVIMLAFVPFEAVTVLESVGVTLYRLYVSRRKLLEWRTAAQAAHAVAGLDLPGIAARMAPALLLSLGVLVLVVAGRPGALWLALPVTGLWLAAPVVAHRTGRPLDVAPEALDEAQRRAVHGLARRTWLYFEQFVGPNDNWLPPDNVQGAPNPVTAHRTSPTNIGLLLLSTLAAHDLGYLGLVDLSLRLRQTLEVLGRMERYRGHLLNWYDTRTLAPLAPRYVSSVDSGNLLGSLVAVREGCLEVLSESVAPRRRWGGLTDTMDVLADTLRDALGEEAELVAHVERMRARVTAVAEQPDEWPALLDHLVGDAMQELKRLLVEAFEAGAFGPEERGAVRAWAERVGYNVRVTQLEFDFLMPWSRAFLSARAWEDALPAPAARVMAQLRAALATTPTLRQLERRCRRAIELLAELKRALEGGEPTGAEAWCDELASRLSSCAGAARGLVAAFEGVAAMADAEVEGADFTFLYDPDRALLHIGYDVDAERLDDNYYDLLASEARLASLIAIAKGELPVKHWLHLGRPLTDVGGRATLLSWSGTMFEYLMPNLLTRRYPGTLLEQSCAAAVEGHIAFARRHGVPWGVSESAYGRVDAAGTYQYRAFGVPELGLDRGQEGDLVVAPYASMLALQYRPAAVLENLRRLEGLGALGPYGLYEALDFTPARKPIGRDHVLVRAYMAHHQGMILVALANALTDDAMVRRFHADPRVATVELLLQERVPAVVPPADTLEREPPRPNPVDLGAFDQAWAAPVESPSPQAHLLSNGRYSVLITAAGAGYSACEETAITRWRPDGTLEEHGTFVYLHDLDDGRLWSATRQPLGPAALDEAEFAPHQATFTRQVDELLSRLEVAVAEDDAELRRLTLVNQSDRPRRLKVTSYAEVVLGDAAGDQRHPAFSKLFVESVYLPEQNALLFRRRPRSAEEAPEHAAHALVLDAGTPPTGEFESDRKAFLGRGRGVRDAAGPRGTLGGGVGATLDPVMALGQTLELAPHSQATLTFVTAYGHSRRALVATIERLQRPGAVQRELELARNRSRLELRRRHVDPADLRDYQRLLSALLYPGPTLRAPPEVLAANQLGQPGLWGHGISGDYPVLLARVDEQEELQLVSDLVRAHGYWRRRGVKVDVVILNARGTGYSQELQGRLRWLLSRTGGDDWLDARGGIFLLREDQLAPQDLTLLRSVARVILDADAGPLSRQLDRLWHASDLLPPLRASDPDADHGAAAPPVARPEGLAFDNGWGGFADGGREYQVYLPGGALPPAPWANVVANETVGFLATEGGLGSSWAVNSGENRLTPWHNDPVTDPPAEVVYLRDEETAEVWSATPLPCNLEAPCLVRHGAGYTVWEHASRGLEHELEAFVAADDPVKLVRLRLTNRTERARRVTATYFAPWVLGVDHATTQLHVVPGYDAVRCVLLAGNRYNAEFGALEAFLASNKAPHGVTTDRREFLGRLGSLARPAALERVGLSGAVRAGADPCAALQLHLDLPPGGGEEVLFVLGQAEGRERALELADRYRDLGRLAEHRAAVTEKWEALLGQVQVETPDPALDLLTNRWLNYQTLAARLWGRSAFYQSSGAYGFRDQLQDVLALLHVAPGLARAQVLRAAAHQFEEGDVLHWWHPPSGRGVRTRISDDLLWLPYVTARYVEATGDEGVLDEEVPFLTGPRLAPGEHERYDHYPRGGSATLLEHCRRAIERGATEGRHGLPLIGGGDWNDGMNRVGVEGRGESVWLAWFLVVTLRGFAGLLRRVGREHEASDLEARAERYVEAAQEHAWDGEWYLRAFYDDGTPLGSREDRECRIDSIAQSWSVFALGDHERGRQALAQVEVQLVRREDGLIRLFAPAFDRTERDPGYIKGYLPGVRENGGQYTHGAIWTAWAFAALGDGDKAHELYQLLAPVRHAQDPAGVARYQVEPYVIAADVYSLEPHVGRGGWTWYTGSASWFYRLGLEALLGLRKRGASLAFEPALPRAWDGYRVVWREGASTYRVQVKRAARRSAVGASEAVRRVTLDGAPLPDLAVPLRDDGRDHEVVVELG